MGTRTGASFLLPLTLAATRSLGLSAVRGSRVWLGLEVGTEALSWGTWMWVRLSGSQGAGSVSKSGSASTAISLLCWQDGHVPRRPRSPRYP